MISSVTPNETRKYILFISRGANAQAVGDASTTTGTLASALKTFGLDNVLLVYVDSEPHTQVRFEEVAA